MGGGLRVRAGRACIVSWGLQTLFGRTAALIAGALLAFSIIAWQVIVWTSLVPVAGNTAHQLAAQARDAITANDAHRPLPPDVRFVSGPPPAPRLIRGLAFGSYLESVRTQLQRELDSPDVRISRLVAPAEVWVRVDAPSAQWLVLTWRFAGPRAPFAALTLIAGAALIVLIGAAWSARRLTAPLGELALAASQVAEGRRVDINTESGPGEVRALAIAFQAMSNRLLQVDGERELMLGGISHDLRTPLARIRVALELLENQDPALMTEMTASIEEMDRMVGQFLHYVRANYREAPTEAVLDDVVRESLAMYGADPRLGLELQAEQPRVFAVQCLRHAVLNLVANALEYGKAPVSVRTRIHTGSIELSVQDAGAGLSESQWRDALLPFHRVSAETGDGHSGLGLAMVERLISNGGGSLVAERVHDGFRITAKLPIKS
jgi:two-component system, OmpR family, osmolarity sensor histidine kinase EnvZ